MLWKHLHQILTKWCQRRENCYQIPENWITRKPLCSKRGKRSIRNTENHHWQALIGAVTDMPHDVSKSYTYTLSFVKSICIKWRRGGHDDNEWDLICSPHCLLTHSIFRCTPGYWWLLSSWLTLPVTPFANGSCIKNACELIGLYWRLREFKKRVALVQVRGIRCSESDVHHFHSWWTIIAILLRWRFEVLKRTVLLWLRDDKRTVISIGLMFNNKIRIGMECRFEWIPQRKDYHWPQHHNQQALASRGIVWLLPIDFSITSKDIVRFVIPIVRRWTDSIERNVAAVKCSDRPQEEKWLQKWKQQRLLSDDQKL
jgi:hypothetical protein